MDYDLEYDLVKGYSNLKDIQLQGLNGEKFNKTVFQYGDYTVDSGTEYYDENYYNPDWEEEYLEQITSGDFDGNGINDICVRSWGYDMGQKVTWYKIYFREEINGNIQITSDVRFGATSYNDLNPYADMLAGDFDGDGTQDFCVISSVEENDVRKMEFSIWAIHPNGNCYKLFDNFSFEFQYTGSQFSGEEIPFYSIAELNGDGINDLVFINKNSKVSNSEHDVYLWISDPESSNKYDFKNIQISMNNIEIEDFWTGDYNQDGLTDLLCAQHTSSKISINSGTGNFIGNPTENSNIFHKEKILTQADFNNDGLIDLIIVDENDNTFLALNKTNSFLYDRTNNLNYTWTNKKDVELDRCFIDDVNNDLFPDLIIADEVGKTLTNKYDKTIWRTYINYFGNGGTLTHQAYGDYENTDRSKRFLYSDITGDGKLDRVRYEFNDGSIDRFEITEKKYSDLNPHLLKNVTTGIGNSISIQYTPLTEINDHFSKLDFDYPLIAVANSIINLVSSYSDGLNDYEYFYEGAQSRLQRRVFLGFSKISSLNIVSNIKTLTETSFNSEYCSPELVNSKTYYNETELISESERIFQVTQIAGKRYKLLPQLEWNHDNLKNTLDSVIYENHDSYTLPRTVIEKHYRGTTLDVQITSSLVYDHSISPWKIGDVEKNTIISKRGPESETKITDYEYYLDTRALHKKYKHKNTNYELKEEYTYDEFGNVLSSSLTAREDPDVSGSLITRTNTFTYSTDGRFRNSAVNDLGHTTIYTYFDLTGLLRFEEDDENNLITEYVYDNFGRLQRTIASNNLEQLTTYHWNVNHNDKPENAHTYSIEQTHGSPDVINFFDKYGRKLRTVSKNFDNTKLYEDYFFNDKSQLWKEILPYKPGEDTYFTKYTYDNYGRIIRIDYPDNGFTTKNYSNPDYIVTETGKGANKQTVKKYYNSLGEIYKSIDNEGNNVLVYYYPNGLPKEYDYGNNNKVYLSYDVNGNRISISDPDAGIITSVYNSFGELIAHTNANGNLTKYEYDNLSRITKEEQYSGTSILENTKLYFYDSDFTGALDAVQQRKPEIQTSAELFSTYLYNDFGQLASRTERIDYNEGTYTYDIVRQFNISYDVYGRIETKSYPYNFDVDYTYQNGYLHTITSGGTILWDCESINSLGNVTSFKMGTRTSQYNYNAIGELQAINQSGYKTLNYAFDDFGNLTSREDATNNLREEFSYDAMNRLTYIKYYENGVRQYKANKIFEYDDSGYGNILNKTGVGDYSYGSKPHAVTGITYTDYHPNPQTINYTTFNKVSTITQTNESEEEISILIEYGANNERRKATFQNTAAPYMNYKKYYFGDYEEKVQGATKTRYYFVNSQTGLCAINVATTSSSTLWHVNLDHLGSPTLLIDSDDYLNRNEYSYSAWGIRRDPYDWRIEDNNELIAERGFTGHEHLEEFELINMNGRVYDPVMAHFLSPDPYIQLPGFRSGFNRYSYCLNNPLIFTDPSGEIVIELIGMAVGAYLNGMAHNEFEVNPFEWNWSDFGTYYSVLSGGFSGYSLGHSLNTRVKENQHKKRINSQIEKLRNFPVTQDGKLKKSDLTLLQFSYSVFEDYKYLDKGNLIYDNSKVPKIASAMTDLKNGYENEMINIYFSDNSFESKWHLFRDMGHEFVHLANYIELGDKYVSVYSEYAAYYWTGVATKNFDAEMQLYHEYHGYKWNPENLFERTPLKRIVEPEYMNYSSFGLWPYYPSWF